LAAAEDLPPHQIADRDDAAVFLLHRTDELGTHEVLKNINLDMNIKDLKSMELWFVTGSQHLYGEETLKQVADHASRLQPVCTRRGGSVTVVYKPVVKSHEEIQALCSDAKASKTASDYCLDAYLFAGQNVDRRIKILQKPLLHLHTQFNRDILERDRHGIS
jgi:L-arabinose isomerase